MKTNLKLRYQILIFLIAVIIITVSAFWYIQVAIIAAIVYVINLIVYIIRKISR